MNTARQAQGRASTWAQKRTSAPAHRRPSEAVDDTVAQHILDADLGDQDDGFAPAEGVMRGAAAGLLIWAIVLALLFFLL